MTTTVIFSRKFSVYVVFFYQHTWFNDASFLCDINFVTDMHGWTMLESLILLKNTSLKITGNILINTTKRRVRVTVVAVKQQ